MGPAWIVPLMVVAMFMGSWAVLKLLNTILAFWNILNSFSSGEMSLYHCNYSGIQTVEPVYNGHSIIIIIIIVD